MDVEEHRRGIRRKGRKFIVNMRLPGGKKTWITVDDRNLAERVVWWIDFYVAAFNRLPADHPDVPGLLEEFRNGEFKQVVLQALESDTAELLQPPAANNFTAAEVLEDSVHYLYRDHEKTEEPPLPTDAPESSFVCFACGGRGAKLLQVPRNPPRQMQAGVDPGHLAEVVERMIMVEEHNHQAKMAEWRRLLQMFRDEGQRAATQGVTPTYGSPVLDPTIQASIPFEVHEPCDARGGTPAFDTVQLEMLDAFVLDYPGA